MVIDESIIQVKVPLPFPLRWVNAYVIQSDHGITLIDPGLHTHDAEDSWQKAMQEIGITYRDIEKIILTHHHPDHYGMAGWFQQQTEAPVYISDAGKRQVDYLWGFERNTSQMLYSLFKQHGMETAVCDAMFEHMNRFVEWVSPQPEMTSMHEDELIMLGNRNYRTIHTPGHAYGHLCFYHEASGDIFCGDHVLPQITPNVGLNSHEDNNPLHSFLESLNHVSTLNVTRAFPGHRDPFTNFSVRCRELIQHHEERLERLVEMIDKPRTAYDLCLAYFGNKLSIHQLRFALGETLAHLIYLKNAGRLQEEERQGIVYFSQ